MCLSNGVSCTNKDGGDLVTEAHALKGATNVGSSCHRIVGGRDGSFRVDINQSHLCVKKSACKEIVSIMDVYKGEQ